MGSDLLRGKNRELLAALSSFFALSCSHGPQRGPAFEPVKTPSSDSASHSPPLPQAPSRDRTPASPSDDSAGDGKGHHTMKDDAPPKPSVTINGPAQINNHSPFSLQNNYYGLPPRHLTDEDREMIRSAVAEIPKDGKLGIGVDPAWWTPTLSETSVEKVPHVEAGSEAGSPHAYARVQG